ncbi:hypothetical protein H5200_06425 [Pseudoalteromonas sp. SG43-7]|jgi:hypothetical protein|uniref:Amino acid ABC transporter substrate-binding protein n=1 Tax=Pseudoalteromonas neustonica TaxID=1840331 RepID=A0ABY3FGP2_9GAMM|nr:MULTISPECIES: hypothetical protein [Pseudoalteromonas]MBB1309691.1 hypothetical protein [Pseudoalteromonas sp. SR41-8]MBB1334112.1 hypothetical protein [Pseudoalteromonas sp. SR41-6]MBB1342037.1 hypothetical protein [Pseudoalteromonas sp. SR45-6]MBB1397028.1 hypothetical protein [Pseudoalteromonas sp. SG44-8]MBB1408447.1 hypothetical protein [Pseudoalteromonas sp. SG44-17]|tara:strand:- start:8907 stop:9818 length:912 start_codon:yes stop_codon:yes gene_type:complete
MKKRIKWLLVTVSFYVVSNSFFAMATDQSIAIFIRDDVHYDYTHFLAGRAPQDITDFSGRFIRRDVVDMIIAQQALYLGGFNKTFSYQIGKINFRNTKLLEKGELLISFDSYWYEDAKSLADKVYISDELIRKGEYFAGIFTSPNNKKVFQLQHLSDFNQLTSVSTPRWRTDWKTLSQLPLKDLVAEDEWLSQVRMVSMQWIDFMLMPLMPQMGNQYVLEDIVLQAVPNVLILLDDSRHFVISKRHPDGAQAFKALQKGLKILREQGAIEKAYRQAGFIPELSEQLIINLPLTRKLVQRSFPK